MGKKLNKLIEMKDKVGNTCKVITGTPVRKPHISGTGPVFVFISGLLGTGECSSFEHIMPYWGLTKGDLLLRLEKETGSECYATSVGPLSSAWDRACELYAQLTGGRVDYGVAHSQQYGHARYGRTYDAMFEGWSSQRPVHLLGHSFGGATARLFAQLCFEGSERERLHTPDDELSPLFKGGMLDRILSITTLSAPHNGSTAICTIQNDQPLWPFIMPYGLLSLIGSIPVVNGLYDSHLEHFKLTNPTGEYYGNHLNYKRLKHFMESRDHATADVSLDGAQELNRSLTMHPELYYFSYAVALKSRTVRGRKVIPIKEFKDPFMWFWGAQMGLATGFARSKIRVEDRSDQRVRSTVAYDPLWLENDGAVPLASGLYPFGQPHHEYVAGEKAKPGIWNVMPIKRGADHGYYCGWDPNNNNFEELVAFYLGHMKLLNEACSAKKTEAVTNI